jgi:hypothetical protein
MKLRLAFSVIALTLLPGLALAMCGHDRQAMSCAEGTTYDTTSGTCVPDATT